MRKINIILKLFIQLAIVWVSLPAKATIKLPALVSNGMVIQRDKKVHLWGWASPGESVVVSFNTQTVNTTAKENNRWDAYLQPMTAGGPFKMVIRGLNTITITNILIGDVWLCSGQSNMAYQLYKSAQEFPADVAKAGDYKIREFTVKNPYKFEPQLDAVGAWKQADSVSVLNFSAVGFFFAQNLYKIYKVPIGIIHSSFPGSPAEAWISEDGLKDFPYYLAKASTYKDTAYTNAIVRKDKQVLANWLSEVDKNDQGLHNGRAYWSSHPDTSNWKSMTVPGYWEDQGAGDINGVVWIKKTVTLPVTLLKQPVFLELGMVVDIDSTYINGVYLGSKDNKYLARRYKVPDGVLRPGVNTIVVRIINKEERGGIVPGRQYRLTDGIHSVDLSGTWQYKVGYATTALPGKNFTRLEFMPGIQYHSRLEPLLAYTIKGVAWYQGESNVNKAAEYRQLLPALIDDWRSKWHEKQLPFLIVQLAGYMAPPATPVPSNLAMLREAQYLVSQTTPYCGLAVAIDVGDAYDIHPPNKKDVGQRLALVARRIAYGDKSTETVGPVYKGMQVNGNKIILAFNNVAKGLTAKGGDLKQFAIAGKDKVFHWAKAKIENNGIVVWSEQVPDPLAVRYAWADNPEGCNLFNTANLPAYPFRTDNWDN